MVYLLELDTSAAEVPHCIQRREDFHMSDQVISVIARTPAEETGTRGIQFGTAAGQFNPAESARGVGLYNVPLQDFEENLTVFVGKISESLCRLHTVVEGYELDEVEVSAEVTATGGINFVGIAEAGVKGGITLKFKRKHGSETEGREPE